MLNKDVGVNILIMLFSILFLNFKITQQSVVREIATVKIGVSFKFIPTLVRDENKPIWMRHWCIREAGCKLNRPGGKG